MSRTTPENLTTTQIRAMRAEALDADDYAAAAICDLALDGEIDTDDYTTLERDEVELIRGMNRDTAYKRIAEWIADAEAQR